MVVVAAGWGLDRGERLKGIISEKMEEGGGGGGSRGRGEAMRECW